MPTTAGGVDVAPGAHLGVAGQARQTRLGLDPRVRRKLEAIESAAHAARAEVFRQGDLIEGERRHAQELLRQEDSWRGNYMQGITQADVDRLAADRAASEQEVARLTALRDEAQERWQRLNRLAERCRIFLGLPADGRRS